MPDLKLFCLGPPVLVSDDQPVKLEMRKSLALLVILRLGEHDRSRESLTTLFWPEYDQKHAQANFRRALASLNKSLVAGIIEADREYVGLTDASAVWLDIDAFKQHLAAVTKHAHAALNSCPDCLASLDEAIRLYRGDFMEGFNLGDCPDFDEWQFLQRENLRQEFAAALQMAADGYAAQTRWETAITYARRWVALDRLNEQAQRYLVSLYARAGQRSAALRQFDEIERLLKVELGQDPEKETADLMQKIRGGETPALPSPTVPPPTPGVAPIPAEPLLKSKLYIPFSRGKKVQRLHLVEKLGGIDEHGLTLLSAPAGFGKTTALTEWAAQCSLPVGWVSLDRDDNNPMRFLSYIVAALDSIQCLTGDDILALLHFSRTSSLQAVLVILLHELEQIRQPFVLVLDDYQFIENPQIHELVAFTLDHQPASLHLVLSSRANPPFPLARLRSRGQLLEIRADDLRFTLEEAHDYLNQVMGLQLSAEDIACLDQRTEGWVAGLQMAAHSLKDLKEPTQFIQSFSGSQRYILDYLVEEALNRQPAPVRDFLLQTSILARLSGPLCDAVTGVRQWPTADLAAIPLLQPPYSGGKILEYLDRINLFIVPLDDERRWYRYHHLFADLLKARLGQAYPERQASLHQRAAGWFMQNGLLAEAIQHAMAAQDNETAVHLVEKISTGTLTHSRLVTLLGWVNRLPRELAWQRPWLMINYAWAQLVTSQFQGLEELLQKAEELVRLRPDTPDEAGETGDMLGNITMVRAYIAFFRGDLDGTIQQALLASQQVRKENRNLYSLVSLQLGETYLILGQVEASQHHLREALRMFHEIGDIHGAAVAYRRLAQLYRFQGRLAATREVSAELLQQVERRFGRQSPVIAFAEIGLGYYAYETNRLDEAESFLISAVAHTQLLKQPYEEISALNGLAWIFIARRDFVRAWNVIDQGADLIAGYTIPPIVRDTLETTKVRLWLAQGDILAARNWVAERRLRFEDDLFFPHEILYLTLSRVLIADQHARQALSLLDRLAGAARAAGRYGRLIEIQVQQALAAYALGEQERAFEALENSLLLAEPEGFTRVFLDEGNPMEAILHAALAHGRWSSRIVRYCARLLEAFDAQPITRSSTRS